MSGLTYAIADMHGRFDLLCRALDLIRADHRGQPARVVILGDFVDRGPNSRGIVDLLSRGPDPWRQEEWIVLQGNHEAMMLEVLAAPTPELMRWWMGNGGDATLRSYGYGQGDPLMPLKVPAEHLDWLRDLPVTCEDDHRIFVHAGVPFDQPLSEAKRETLQWMLYAGYDPGEDSATILPDERHVSGKHIVHGHEQSATHPLLKPHRTNLDSFAWYTGHLAIGVFDDTQAAPVRVLSAIGRPA